MPVLVLLPLVAFLFWYVDRRLLRQIEQELKKTSDLSTLLRLGATNGMASLARDIAFVSLIVFGMLVLFAWIAEYIIRLHLDRAGQLLHSLAPIEKAIQEVKGWTGLATLLLIALTAICALYRYKTAHSALVARLRRLYLAEVQRLQKEQAAGGYQVLPPTEEMLRLIRSLDERGQQMTAAERDKVLKEIVRIDFERRMNLDWDHLWDPKAAMEEEPCNIAGRVLYYFSGKAPLKSLKTGQRWVSTAAMACWCLAAVGIGAHGIVFPAVHDGFVTAWDIVVGQSGDASGTDSDPQAETAATPSGLSQQDLDRIDRLARQFERAATQTRPFWTKAKAANHAYQERQVREFILHNAERPHEAKAAASAAEDASSWPGSSASADAGVQEEASFAEAAAKETGPQTEIGKVFRDRILRLARNPERWSKWQVKLANIGDFLRYTGIEDAGDAAFGEFWGQAVRGMGVKSDLGKQLLNKIPKAAFNQAFFRTAAKFESALDGRISFEQAFEQVRDLAWDHPTMQWAYVENIRDWTDSLAREENITDFMRDRPPYFPSQPDAAPFRAEAQKAAEAYSETIRGWFGVDEARSLAEELVVYDDWLMPRAGNPPQTLRTSFLARTAQAVTPTEVQESYALSRNFDKLRGFSRVGGIMIGREAKSGALNVTGFSWENGGPAGVRLRLTRKDGAVIASRPFDAETLRLALAYSADGRPVAVTIMNAPQLLRMRVLLHPTLVDTTLGNDLITADEWIFKKKDRTHIDAGLQRAEDPARLYEIAWYHRLIPNVQADAAEDLRHESKFREDAISSRSAELFKHSADWLNPSLSPLSAKDKGFDPALVSWMQSCADPQKSVSSFGSCIESNASREFREMPEEKQKSTWQAWTAGPPRPQSMSHIRELPFDLDSGLGFIGPLGKESVGFDYLIQTTFGKGDTFVDTAPWADSALAPEAQAAIAEQMQLPENQRIMSRLIDFRDTQRLFRLALNGSLGKDFPLWSLAELSSTLPPPSVSATPRWRVPGDDLRSKHIAEEVLEKEISSMLQKAGPRLDAAVRAQLEKCASYLRSRTAGTNSRDGEAAVCNFQSLRVKPDAGTELGKDLEATLRAGTRMTYIWKLQRALGAE